MADQPLRPPKTSIFDLTLNETPSDPQGLLGRWRRRRGEPPSTKEAASALLDPLEDMDTRPVIMEPTPMRPIVVEARMPLEERLAGKPSGWAPPDGVDDDLFDEGTAAEWHPKWAQMQGMLAPTPPVAPVSAPAAVGRRTFHPWIAGGGAALLGFVGIGVLMARPRMQVPVPPPVTPELQPYLAKANSGDVSAMRMVGLRYVYGVASPQNREEGIRWLRKASLAGSQSAAQELKALGITTP